MGERATMLRSLHDTGLAAWFGGSLMGAVGLNGAAAQASNRSERLAIASNGWKRWAPVNLAAIGAHLAGSAALLVNERGRVAGQRGVLAMAATKTGLTAAALGATAYTGMVGMKMSQASNAAVEGPNSPSAETPAQLRGLQHRQRIAQWMVPAFTGALIAISALAGEQQKPASVMRGMVARAGKLSRRMLPIG